MTERVSPPLGAVCQKKAGKAKFMTASARNPQRFNILIVAQAGRLQYEALLFAASLSASNPDFAGRLIIAVPEGDKWARKTALDQDVADELQRLGGEIRPFTSRHFGQDYPYGNKIEALSLLPAGEPFVFFDTDTLITGNLENVGFDFTRPSASMMREGTWPKIELYGPGYNEIWGALYQKFGLDMASSLDLSQPDEHWERYLYFNAGWFFYQDPAVFGARFEQYALAIRDDAPEALICQSLDPWLDQVALPLVIHSLGGGRPGEGLAGLDGAISQHWRVMALFYARASDEAVAFLEEITAPNRIKKLLKRHEPFKRMIYQGRGRKARALFDRQNLPPQEKAIRNRLKREGFWMR